VGGSNILAFRPALRCGVIVFKNMSCFFEIFEMRNKNLISVLDKIN